MGGDVSSRRFTGPKKLIPEFEKAEAERLLLDEIMGNMVEGVCFAGINDGAIKYCNFKFEDIFGYGIGETAGKDILMVSVFGGEEPAAFVKEIFRVLDKTGQWQGEVETKRKDGALFWCYVKCSLFQHSVYGRVILAIYSDITERRKAQGRQNLLIELLAVLNRKDKEVDVINLIFVRIQEFMKIDAVGIRLSKGNDYPYYVQNGFSEEFIRAENFLCKHGNNGRMLFDNNRDPCFECMCGVILKRKTDFSKPFFTEGGSFWTNSITDFLAAVPDSQLTSRMRNYCNASGYESMALIPIRSNNHIVGLLQLNDRRRGVFTLEFVKFLELVCSSIGMAVLRRQADEELARYRDGLENMLREKTMELQRTCRDLEDAKRLSDIGMLAATVAHELRNPLAVIKTAVYNIKRKTSGGFLDSHIASIDKKTSESDAIIRNLLSYSRIKVPYYEIKSVSEILNLCIDGLQNKYAKWDVRLDVESNCGSGDTIEADFLHINELFSNILDNSYQAFPEKKGVIKISIDCNKKENTVVMVFQDNGTGIDKNDLLNIFNPFFTTKARGIGLGLTVCKQVVSLHKGEFDIKSVKGEGTTVTVRLPMRKPE